VAVEAKVERVRVEIGDVQHQQRAGRVGEPGEKLGLVELVLRPIEERRDVLESERHAQHAPCMNHVVAQHRERGLGPRHGQEVAGRAAAGADEGDVIAHADGPRPFGDAAETIEAALIDPLRAAERQADRVDDDLDTSFTQSPERSGQRSPRVDVLGQDPQAVDVGRHGDPQTRPGCHSVDCGHDGQRKGGKAFQQRVEACLEPGAAFAFDVQIPDLIWLERDPNKRWARTRYTDPHTRRAMIYSTNHDWDVEARISYIRLFYEPADGKGATKIVKLAQRKYFPSHLAALVTRAGFRMIARYADWGWQPLVLIGDDAPPVDGRVPESQVLVVIPDEKITISDEDLARGRSPTRKK